MITPARGNPVPGLMLALRRLAAAVLAPIVPRTRKRRRSRVRATAPGHVVLLGAGPGSADLITLRGLRALQSADVVLYDRLADPALLAQTRHGARLVSVGKAPGAHAVPQDRINALLVQAARQGHRVVRLKCGDPGVFGRGAEEASALDQAGIAWSIIPGVTAACAAAAAAGSFLTERGRTERVILATGHRRAGDQTDWAGCAAPGTTLACYMGVTAAAGIQAELLAAGWPALSQVEIVSCAQTARQRVLHGTLADLAALCNAQAELNPAILLIRWPAPSALSAHRGLAEAADPQARKSSPRSSTGAEWVRAPTLM